MWGHLSFLFTCIYICKPIQLTQRHISSDYDLKCLNVPSIFVIVTIVHNMIIIV